MAGCMHTQPQADKRTGRFLHQSIKLCKMCLITWAIKERKLVIFQHWVKHNEVAIAQCCLVMIITWKFDFFFLI